MRRLSFMRSDRSRGRPSLHLSAFLAVALVVAGCGQAEPTPSTDTPSAGVSVDSTTTTIPDVVVVTGSTADGYGDVTAELASARQRWEETAPAGYGFLLETICACDQAGRSWVRVFPEVLGEEALEVATLFERLDAAVAARPDTIEVAFAETDGHPVSYRFGGADGEISVAIEHFHSIEVGATEFDGTWRFASGTVDGKTFRNPASMGNFLTLDGGWATYTVSCNTAFAAADIYSGWIGIGPAGVTDVGCGEYPPENDQFVMGLQRAETIQLEEPDLLIGGPGIEMRLVRAAVPEYLGDLPLTAAGETLTFEIPDARRRFDQYIITGSPNDLGGAAYYLLTTATAGSDGDPSWQRWEGEPDTAAAVVVSPGPDTVVIPDDISEGDFGLCSPYWEPDRFCFTLRVRPPSAPWIVTAGRDGVVLHDADGTSDVVSTVPASLAFYVDDGRFVLQPLDRPDRLVVVDVAGEAGEIPLDDGETLLDAAIVDGRAVLLVASGSQSSRVDLDSQERVVIGGGAVEGRVLGAITVLRTAPERVEAIEGSGPTVWERSVAADAMITFDGQGRLRFDIFHTIQANAGPGPYYKYIATELVNPANGETVESFEREVAIPDEGHEVAEICTRTEVEDGLLLCALADERIVTLDPYDWTRVFASGAAATFARSAPG